MKKITMKIIKVRPAEYCACCYVARFQKSLHTPVLGHSMSAYQVCFKANQNNFCSERVPCDLIEEHMLIEVILPYKMERESAFIFD